MNEEIIKVLDELGKRFGMAIDWSNQNVMPYLQDLMGRFICYKNTQAIFWIILLIIAIGLNIWGIKKLFNWKNSIEYDKSCFSDDGLTFGLCLVGLIITIFFFLIVLICNIQGLAQNIFVPELTVLEYLKAVK